MSKRLEILKASLIKKQEKFDATLQHHFDTVALANGQPLNDKRGGYKTLQKWDRQNETLRNIDASIEKTKAAIEREESKIAAVNAVELPECIKNAIDQGLITQWRKFPRFFFVVGVEKARFSIDEKSGQLAHRYLNAVSKEEFAIFRDVYNALNAEMKKIKHNQKMA
jgi:hypothetical protein